MPGEREVDYVSDFWADHDDDCHGPKENFEDELPEGFLWTCCEQRGDVVSCQIGRHSAEIKDENEDTSEDDDEDEDEGEDENENEEDQDEEDEHENGDSE